MVYSHSVRLHLGLTDSGFEPGLPCYSSDSICTTQFPLLHLRHNTMSEFCRQVYFKYSLVYSNTNLESSFSLYVQPAAHAKFENIFNMGKACRVKRLACEVSIFFVTSCRPTFRKDACLRLQAEAVFVLTDHASLKRP
jgi:hypothetical protein